MAEKKRFNFIMLFFDCRQHLELLTDEQRGKLLLALFNYAEYGIAPELDPASQMAFSFLSAQILSLIHILRNISPFLMI